MTTKTMKRAITLGLLVLGLAGPAHAADPLPAEAVERMTPDCRDRYTWLLMRVNGLQSMETDLKAGRALLTEKGEWLRGDAAARWLVEAMNAATTDVRALTRDCVKR
jgi:hypothetical protein